jgi:transposase-like protein
MGDITCRNCGKESVFLNTSDEKRTHYDCSECNYQWYGVSVKSMAKQLLSHLSFGIFQPGKSLKAHGNQ